jgi:hypothetical protein
MDIVKGRSVRFDAIAWTMSSCSGSGIFAICCGLMRPITTRSGRTYRSARMLRCRVPSGPPARLDSGHFSVDFTISTSEFDFRQAQPPGLARRFWQRPALNSRLTFQRLGRLLVQLARYDLIFVFDRPSGSGPITRFTMVAQQLLAGDGSK